MSVTPRNDRPSAVIADDHVDLARMIASKLEERGWCARPVRSGRAAIAAVNQDTPDLVITDLRMPDADGFAVLEHARRTSPVIVISGFGDVQTAVEAMRRGACRFVEKPVRLADLADLAGRVLDDHRSAPRVFADLVGASKAMRDLEHAAARVARSHSSVLVRGESGTGKELVALAIHAASARSTGPFVAINCAAIPDTLVESELFGHARGAFTGAAAPRRGLFLEADGGTLFLDEIGDMPLATQGKLLRVLQDGELRAVGGEGTRKVDVRVIAATHQALEELVRVGRFRADLFYRLAVVPIRVPPLRERRGDVALLARHFLARARARDPATIVHAFDDSALAALDAYPWPGNVRELEHLVERLAILGTAHELGLRDLHELAPEIASTGSSFAVKRDELVTLRELEAEYIAWVLERCGGSKARAAEVLGVDASTLYRRARVT